MPTLRVRQINRQLRDYIALAIMRLVELPAGVVVSVTKVQTTADLQHAKVFLSIVPDELAGSTMELIKRNAPAVIDEVASHITFRIVPRFHFAIDDTERKAARIEALLDTLK